jgi:hypothetical protein
MPLELRTALPSRSDHIPSPKLPVACTLGPDDGPARLARWKALHASAVPVFRLVGHELKVRYRAAPGVKKELEELAIAEQSCCGFLEWQVSEDDGQPVLRVLASGESLEGLATVAALFGHCRDHR